MTAVITLARSPRSTALVAAAGGLAVMIACALLAPLTMTLIVAVWAAPVATATAIDTTAGRLPDVVVLPGTVAVFASATLTGHLLSAVGGAVLLAAPMLTIHLARPDGLGFGDVKFGLLLGAGVGTVGVALVPISFLLAAALQVAICCALHSRDRLVPFGPALAAAAGIVITLGIWRLR